MPAVPARAREKFATQINSGILAEVRRLAETEGRQIQALMDEALADLLEKRKRANPRPHVMAAYSASHTPYAAVFRKLAE